jgi:muconate cycloisomerase
VKIKAIEPIAVSLPMKKPVQMAGETVARADNVLVRIEADNGAIGWGEAASAPTMTGETVASMMAAVDHMAPGLRGRAADDFAGVATEMAARMYGNTSAKAAIDMALYDLVGRVSQRPVHALLGTKLRNSMPLLAIVGSEDAAADLRDAEARWAAGYRTFKVKVGLGTPQADAERTRFVCTALKRKGDCVVSSDANQGFTVDGALQYVRALGNCGLDFFEQPVEAHDLAGMMKIAEATPVAIGTDEGIHSLADLEHHYARGVRGASLKAIKLGGLRAMLEACRLCDRLGMNVNIACKTGESSIGSVAALHVAAVAPAVAWGLSLTSGGLAEDVVVTPLNFAGGNTDVPDVPGLGVEVDERRVRQSAQAFKRVAYTVRAALLISR